MIFVESTKPGFVFCFLIFYVATSAYGHCMALGFSGLVILDCLQPLLTHLGKDILRSLPSSEVLSTYYPQSLLQFGRVGCGDQLHE